MSNDLYLWIKALHLFSIIGWTGGLLTVAGLIALGPRAAEALARRTALSTDLAATVAIFCGLAIIVGLAGAPDSPMKRPHMHLKLTLAVLGYIGMHGYLRVRLKKVLKGEATGLPSFVVPLVLGLALAISLLVVLKPFS